MKTFFLLSPPGAPSLTRARNAALINQLAFPGLGSLLVRRWFAGTGQLLLALASFVALCAWAIPIITTYYRFATNFRTEAAPISFRGLQLSALLLALAWCWSLVTSYQILNSAKTPLPPPIPK
jgi:hypothetical protein